MHFDDVRISGWWVLQDHNAEKDLELRNTMGACRTRKGDDDLAPDAAHGTYGDVLGGLLWESLENKRENLHAWFLTGAGAVSTKGAESQTTISTEDASAGGTKTRPIETGRELPGSEAGGAKDGPWLPIWKAGAQEDVRFKPKDPVAPSFATGTIYPKGWTATISSGTDEGVQQESLHPDFWGLVAVNFAGNPKAGTNVYDINAQGEPGRSARLQTMLSVLDMKAGPVSGKTVALQLGRGGNLDPGGGHLAVVDYGLNEVGVGSAAGGGPFLLGPNCQHNIGGDADGRAARPLHCSTSTLFLGQDHDAPFAFEADPWEVTSGQEFALWQKCHIRADMNRAHVAGPAAGAGLWDVQVSIPVYVPPEEPHDPKEPKPPKPPQPPQPPRHPRRDRPPKEENRKPFPPRKPDEPPKVDFGEGGAGGRLGGAGAEPGDGADTTGGRVITGGDSEATGGAGGPDYGRDRGITFRPDIFGGGGGGVGSTGTAGGSPDDWKHDLLGRTRLDDLSEETRQILREYGDAWRDQDEIDERRRAAREAQRKRAESRYGRAPGGGKPRVGGNHKPAYPHSPQAFVLPGIVFKSQNYATGALDSAGMLGRMSARELYEFERTPIVGAISGYASGTGAPGGWANNSEATGSQYAMGDGGLIIHSPESRVSEIMQGTAGTPTNPMRVVMPGGQASLDFATPTTAGAAKSGWRLSHDALLGQLAITQLTSSGALNENLQLTFNEGDIKVDGAFEVTGKLTVGGLIDPPGLVISESAADPASTSAGEGTFWVRDDTPNVPMFTDDAGTDHNLLTAGGGASTPAGLISPYGGSSAPSGWLLCDGSAVSRTTYSALFAIVSTTYGVGDGSTTFNLPNLKGRSAMGVDAAGSGQIPTSLGATGGAGTHALTTGELATHGHGITDPGHNHTQAQVNHVHTITAQDMAVPAAGGAVTYAALGGAKSFSTNGANANLGAILSSFTMITINDTGSGTAHNNVHPVLGINYIIKT